MHAEGEEREGKGCGRGLKDRVDRGWGSACQSGLGGGKIGKVTGESHGSKSRRWSSVSREGRGRMWERILKSLAGYDFPKRNVPKFP